MPVCYFVWNVQPFWVWNKKAVNAVCVCSSTSERKSICWVILIDYFRRGLWKIKVSGQFTIPQRYFVNVNIKVCEALKHPSCSPDLAPSDSQPFPYLSCFFFCKTFWINCRNNSSFDVYFVNVSGSHFEDGGKLKWANHQRPNTNIYSFPNWHKRQL